ncbi:efflux RND transporter periplasmic adaptor subunit [Desulfovibrio gilichinskyi]|uniref:Membrane fusion protein, multidrug efflux system n=1 Tax=Desulfovibrio gilichinskyi TaxID=1519643 RepID=A0A1X7DF71_9BACT|nr:efflux RND transporter periplasmic adaptor subunit [Desulfovibrio gilichinskyi]SMF14320.1 membrane fusion protein, multidrug efflux system [Desulfovibrio gilichinskyi]
MNFKLSINDGVKSMHCRLFVVVCTLASLVFLGGCFDDDSGKAAQKQAVPVKVYKVVQQDFPVSGEYVAQIQAEKTVEIRSRVDGYLTERNFTEGDIVDEGKLLFKIDPRPYEEALNQAKAELAQSVASRSKASTDYKRFKTLYDQGAVSREELDTKTTNKQVLDAQVNNADSAVKDAELNLSFTKIYSPMKGLIGKTQVNPGSLVTKESTLLATVSAVDPVYVNFNIPEKEYLFTVHDMEERKKEGLPKQSHILQMILADGNYYNQNGTFGMADRAVDSTTGTLGLRAVFPNPDKLLRDGQYAKVVALLKVFEKALVVPARAVLDIQGHKSVLTVAANGTVVENPVTIEFSNDQSAVIKNGIADGDLVIADGVNKIRPGTLVAPEVVADGVANAKGMESE